MSLLNKTNFQYSHFGICKFLWNPKSNAKNALEFTFFWRTKGAFSPFGVYIIVLLNVSGEWDLKLAPL